MVELLIELDRSLKSFVKKIVHMYLNLDLEGATNSGLIQYKVQLEELIDQNSIYDLYQQNISFFSHSAIRYLNYRDRLISTLKIISDLDYDLQSMTNIEKYHIPKSCEITICLEKFRYQIYIIRSAFQKNYAGFSYQNKKDRLNELLRELFDHIFPCIRLIRSINTGEELTRSNIHQIFIAELYLSDSDKLDFFRNNTIYYWPLDFLGSEDCINEFRSLSSIHKTIMQNLIKGIKNNEDFEYCEIFMERKISEESYFFRQKKDKKFYDMHDFKYEVFLESRPADCPFNQDIIAAYNYKIPFKFLSHIINYREKFVFEDAPVETELPAILLETITSNNKKYKIRQITIQDSLTLFAGHLVNCCLHVDGAGEEILDDLRKYPQTGLYIIENQIYKKPDKVVAVMFCWKTENRSFMIDSVEILHQNRISEYSDDVRHCLSVFANELVHRFDFKRVLVGLGSGGLSDVVYPRTPQLFIESSQELPVFKIDDDVPVYSDSDSYFSLAHSSQIEDYRNVFENHFMERIQKNDFFKSVDLKLLETMGCLFFKTFGSKWSSFEQDDYSNQELLHSFFESLDQDIVFISLYATAIFQKEDYHLLPDLISNSSLFENFIQLSLKSEYNLVFLFHHITNHLKDLIRKKRYDVFDILITDPNCFFYKKGSNQYLINFAIQESNLDMIDYFLNKGFLERLEPSFISLDEPVRSFTADILINMFDESIPSDYFFKFIKEKNILPTEVINLGDRSIVLAEYYLLSLKGLDYLDRHLDELNPQVLSFSEEISNDLLEKIIELLQRNSFDDDGAKVVNLILKLVSKGMIIPNLDKNGEPWLLRLARNEQLDVFQAFICAGINIEFELNFLKIIWNLLIENVEDIFILELIKKGASFKSLNSNNENIFEYFIKNNSLDIVLDLLYCDFFEDNFEDLFVDALNYTNYLGQNLADLAKLTDHACKNDFLDELFSYSILPNKKSKNLKFSQSSSPKKCKIEDMLKK